MENYDSSIQRLFSLVPKQSWKWALASSFLNAQVTTEIKNVTTGAVFTQMHGNGMSTYHLRQGGGACKSMDMDMQMGIWQSSPPCLLAPSPDV